MQTEKSEGSSNEWPEATPIEKGGQELESTKFMFF
jgi:hypothetical protein